MSPPAAAIIVSVVATVAVGVAFKHFIYEPYLAPKFEAWAEAYALHRREVRRRRERENRQTASRESLVLSTPIQSHEDISRFKGPSSPSLGHSLSSVELENVAGRREWRADASVGSLGGSMDGAEIRNRRGYSSRKDQVDKPVPHIPYDTLKPTYVVFDSSAPTTPGEELAGGIPLMPPSRSASQSEAGGPQPTRRVASRPSSTITTDNSTIRSSTSPAAQAASALGVTGAARAPTPVVYSTRTATSNLAAAASMRVASPGADMENSIMMSHVYPSPSISSSDSLARSRSGAPSPVYSRADSVRGGSTGHSRVPSQTHSRVPSQTLSNPRSSISADSPMIDPVAVPRSPFSDSISLASVPSRAWSEVDVEEVRSNRAVDDAAPVHVSRPASSAAAGGPFEVLSDEEFEDTGSWDDIRKQH